jgi:carotenoid cleavage dioxygenase-like enzyme
VDALAAQAGSQDTCGMEIHRVFASVHNPHRGASDLAILAAQDFTAKPVARVHLPARIPLGFYGS